MPLVQLAYVSRPTIFEPAVLDAIVQEGRIRNARTGLTGSLISSAGLYLQLIEGEREVVWRCFSRLARDERHTDVLLLGQVDSDRRLFPETALRDDPMPSWMWSHEALRQGGPRKASLADILGRFTRLAAAPPIWQPAGALAG